MENPPALSSSPPSVNSALPAPTDASLAALLAFNADIPFPSQAADVVNLAELVPLCTALQLRAEVSPPFRLTHVAPHAPALLKCLAFWLASFPDADNVVGVVTVLTYVVSLCPSGATEIIRATMPAADEEDMAAAGAAATASAADALTVPRFRLFLPRLLYSVSRTSGREAPYNALISGARAGSLLAALAFSLGEVSARWATAPPPRAPLPPLLLRLRAALLHPSTLSTAARVVATYGARPPPPDPLTGAVSAPVEAAAALQSIARAGAASDGPCGAPCASPLAVARACAGALRTVALTPGPATLLCEVTRNALCFFPPAFDAVSAAARVCGGGWRGWGGVEGAFFLCEEEGELPGVGLAEALGTLRRVTAAAAELLDALLLSGGWLETAVGAPALPAAALAPPPLWAPGGTPALAEHILSAAFNLLASVTLRFALSRGEGPPGFHFSHLLRRISAAAVAALGRFGAPGPSFHAPATAAAIRVLQHPLAATPLLEAPLSYLFFGGGAAAAVAALLGAWAGAGSGEVAAAGALPHVLLPALRVVAAHCEQPGVALSGGALGGALRAATRLARAIFFRPRRVATLPEYEAFSLLASRAANVPPAAWGSHPPHAGALALTPGVGAPPPRPPPGDEPADWAAIAAELIDVMEAAINAEGLEPPAPLPVNDPSVAANAPVA